jgi:hypothetical protein
MQHLAVYILFHTGLLYMFRLLFAPIIMSSKKLYVQPLVYYYILLYNNIYKYILLYIFILD